MPGGTIAPWAHRPEPDAVLGSVERSRLRQADLTKVRGVVRRHERLTAGPGGGFVYSV